LTPSGQGAALLWVPALALVLLVAHFVHGGLWPLAAICLASIALLAIRLPWVARTLQLLLALGALEWIRAAASIAYVRMAHEQPFVRMLAIMGAVTALTVLAALVFSHPALRRRFGLDRGVDPPASPRVP
jgi:hypothetical protein